MTDVAPPYAADARAKGWRFALDYETIEQSSTWALAGMRAPELRGWLLVMWLCSWRQVPCGSFPADEEIIAAMIGMPQKQWSRHRDVMMRGWAEATDGRVYHETIGARVLEMLSQRRKTAERVAAFKASTHSQREGNALPPQRQQVKNDTETETIEETSNLSVAPARPAAEPPQLALVDSPKPPVKPALPGCPHHEVLALWAEVLPSLPRHMPDQWRGTRAAHLRARWRETAVAKDWESTDAGLAYFRKLFGYIGRSEFLTGRARQFDPNKRPFVIELEWLVNPTNWAKVHEGKYHAEEATA